MMMFSSDRQTDRQTQCRHRDIQTTRMEIMIDDVQLRPFFPPPRWDPWQTGIQTNIQTNKKQTDKRQTDNLDGDNDGVGDVKSRPFFPPRWDPWQTISFLLATSNPLQIQPLQIQWTPQTLYRYNQCKYSGHSQCKYKELKIHSANTMQ